MSLSAALPLPPAPRADAAIPHSFTAERGVLDATLAMRHAGIRRLRIAWELQGSADGAVVIVQGGISANRHVASSARFGEAGWWEAQCGSGRAIDTRRHRVLAIDWVGADGCLDACIDPADQADAIAAVIDHLGIARAAAFIGASYGAMVGLQFASRHGARLEHLVAISGAHRSHPQVTALRVVQRRERAGKTPIPRDVVVLSFGGTELPPALDALNRGCEVTIESAFRPLLGTSAGQWVLAQDIVGGAGLLVHRGAPVADWSSEQLAARFDTDRHPRTMIGTGRDGTIWLVTVDGRNPLLSLGMSFRELQRLAQRLGMSEALNLDGGGSTTMVVKGKVVNHPSDPQGPRRVSDAIVVMRK